MAMEARRLGTVMVRTTLDTVTIPWASREELLARLRRRLDPIALEVIRTFEDVGASSPVVLGSEAEALLTGEVEASLIEVSVSNLPEGIWDLRCALIDEAHRGL